MNILGLMQMKIQKGRTTGGTITIDAVSDIKKCIVIVDGGASGYLSSTTALVVTLPKLTTTYYNGSATATQTVTPVATVSWTVIEFGGAVNG